MSRREGNDKVFKDFEIRCSRVTIKGEVFVRKCVMELLAWKGTPKYDFKNLVKEEFADCFDEFEHEEI